MCLHCSGECCVYTISRQHLPKVHQTGRKIVTQQRLRKQRVPRENAAVDTFVQERPCIVSVYYTSGHAATAKREKSYVLCCAIILSFIWIGRAVIWSLLHIDPQIDPCASEIERCIKQKKFCQPTVLNTCSVNSVKSAKKSCRVHRLPSHVRNRT